MKTDERKKSYDQMYGKNMKLNEYYEVANFVKDNLKNPNVLDVGCGYGVFLENFFKEGTGIDSNTEHVKMCKKKGLNVVLGEAEKIPYKDNSFNCVTLMQVIEHSSNPNKVFEEVNRVLKKGGILICTTPSYMSPNAWGDVTHFRTYSTYGLRNLAVDHGFTVKKIYASSMIGEGNYFTRRLCRMLANSKLFPYLQYILYLVCSK